MYSVIGRNIISITTSLIISISNKYKLLFLIFIRKQDYNNLRCSTQERRDLT